mgnify:CR=1 FL=1
MTPARAAAPQRHVRSKVVCVRDATRREAGPPAAGGRDRALDVAAVRGERVLALDLRPAGRLLHLLHLLSPTRQERQR